MSVIESEIKDDPLFSFKNFFKPTTKNVLIWGTGIKTACAALIGFATTIVSTSLVVGVSMIVAGLVIGFLADTFIAFTRQKPEDSLQQAVVDIHEEIIEERQDEH